MSQTSRNCPACRQELPHEAQFCGFCGFRLSSLAAASAVEAPILLTRVKRTGSVQPGQPLREPAPALTAGSTADDAPAAWRRNSTVRPRHPSEHERPRAPRFPLRVEINYTSEHNFYTGFVENISSGGLFIATYDLSPIGDLLEVTFTVPGLDEPCVALCRVCWIREHDPDNPDMIPGMGCRFGTLEQHVRSAIDAFIQHREPIFFEQ